MGRLCLPLCQCSQWPQALLKRTITNQTATAIAEGERLLTTPEEVG